MVIWGTCVGFAAILAGIWLRTIFVSANAGRMSDLQVYKDQMRGLDKDLAKSIVTQTEYQSLRAEIGRRMISASKNSDDQQQSGSLSALALSAVLLAAAGASVAVYLTVGSPDLRDVPLAERVALAEEKRLTRPDQAQAELDVAQDLVTDPDPASAAMIAELRRVLLTRPNDQKGHELLVTQERRLGNFQGAHQAQRIVIDLKDSAATAADWMLYAELQIAAADTYISPQAEDALRQVLQISPRHSLARFRIGMLFLQNERPDRTFKIWRDLLEEGPETAPYIALIRRNIDDLAQISGVRYTPPAPKGPSAQDVEQAAGLSKEQQDAMIASMVASLSDRLATEGGPVQDWARLIAAYGVLGQLDQAQVIWTEAQQRFADRGGDLAILEQAARAAGLQP